MRVAGPILLRKTRLLAHVQDKCGIQDCDLWVGRILNGLLIRDADIGAAGACAVTSRRKDLPGSAARSRTGASRATCQLDESAAPGEWDCRPVGGCSECGPSRPDIAGGRDNVPPNMLGLSICGVLDDRQPNPKRK